MFDEDFIDLDETLSKSQVDIEDTFKSNGNENNNTTRSKKELLKIAITGIVVGTVIILFAISFITGSKDSNSGKEPNKVTVATNTDKEKEPVKQGNDADNKEEQKENKTDTNSINNADKKSESTWKSFDSGEVNFMEDLIESKFIVKSVEHLVKTSENGKNPQVKTILTGELDGIDGNYELEISYYKGKRVQVGLEFDVKVQVGFIGDKRVVGEIVY